MSPFLRIFVLLLSTCLFTLNSSANDTRSPNFVYIMADELGYFEPGFMGGKNILTPHIDQMAREGMKFTQLLAGSSVCAPTRCTLMTGKHSGHASVRKNGGGTPLRRDEITIASLLKTKGYATGGFGKWGCGGRDSTGVPEKHGFDIFLGYYDQVHAHTYYPPYLIQNSEEVALPSNFGMSRGNEYSQYIIHDAAKDFIRSHAAEPFFAYLPYTPPHGLFDIPETDPAWSSYKDKPWPDQAKKYAAMVTMLDRQVGEILTLLKDLKIDDNTLVIFSGDNGGADYFSSREFPRGFHQANVNPKTAVEYRGKKGNLYEGGLRIPFVAHWPGKVAPNQTTDHLGYFPDVMPTFAELADVEVPDEIDGISFAPTLLGESEIGHPQRQHEYLYWEIGNWTAIRQTNWRAVRSSPQGPWELYNLTTDPSESSDLSKDEPERLEHLIQLAGEAHQPAREGTFSSTERHERDRRAKFGRQDESEWSSNQNRSAKHFEEMPKEGLLDNQHWKLIAISSENSENGKFAQNAFDNDPATWWHSQFSNGKADPPHTLTFDLGEPSKISGVVYMARQDGSRNGAVKDFTIEISTDGKTYLEVTAGQFDLSKKPQTKTFAEISSRFIRVICHSDYSEQGFAAISEIGFLRADKASK